MKKIILMASLVVATMSFANQNESDRSEMREPPKEAVLACEGKK